MKKEKKLYLFDYSLIEDKEKKFENYIALELLIFIEAWTDAGIAKFELKYIRTRDGKETDFLILKNNKPWLLFEAKLKASDIANHHRKHSTLLGDVPFVQIVLEENILQKKDKCFFQVSASRFF